MKTKKTPRQFNDAVISFSILVVLIPLISFLSLYLNKYIVKSQYFIDNGLFSFDVVSTTINIGLTGATAIFFVLTFVQQRNEFKAINLSSLKSNELQVINNELDFLSRKLSEEKYGGYGSFYDFNTGLIEIYKDSRDLKLFGEGIKSNIDALRRDTAQILLTTKLLDDNVIHIDYKTYLQSRLPNELFLFTRIFNAYHSLILKSAYYKQTDDIKVKMFIGQLKSIKKVLTSTAKYIDQEPKSSK